MIGCVCGSLKQIGCLLSARSANGMEKKESPRPRMGIGVPVSTGSPLSKDEEQEETLQGEDAEAKRPADPWETNDPWKQGFREQSWKEPRSYGPSNPPVYEQSGPGWKSSHMEFSGPYPTASNGYYVPGSHSGWQNPPISPEDMAWIMGLAMSMKGYGKGKGQGSFGFQTQAEQKEDAKPEVGGDRRRPQKENEDRGSEDRRRGHRRERSGRGGSRSHGSGDSRRPPPGFPGDGGGPPSSEGHTETEASSTINTSELRSMVRQHMGPHPDRPRASLGSVKIEEFYGDRTKYLKWKKAVQAQEVLYRLEEAELSMLVYLSTKKDARDVLDQQPISEYTRVGGIRLLWRLLDEAFGETEDEWFERAETEFASYRRLPGQSVATYLGQLKRLRAQYMRADPGTTISDRAWSQRMLNRASLTRRERLDVFFSAGGRYESAAVEAALRHRCSRIHEDERRLPVATTFKSRRRSKGGGKGSSKGDGKGRSLEKKTFVVDEEAEDWETGSGEDLECEEGAYGAYLENQEDEADEAEEDEEDWEEASMPEEELKEAWAAGWKAKSQQNDRRKNRGWKSSGKGSGGAGSPQDI